MCSAHSLPCAKAVQARHLASVEIDSLSERMCSCWNLTLRHLQRGEPRQGGQAVVRQVQFAQRAQAVQAGDLAQAVGSQVQHLKAAEPRQALDHSERVGRQVELNQLVRLHKRRRRAHVGVGLCVIKKHLIT